MDNVKDVTRNRQATENFDEIFNRIMEALHCNTQTELGKFLGISKSGISNVIKRRVIPRDWVWKLQYYYGIDSNWILTGEGSPSFVDRGLAQSVTHGDKQFFKVPYIRDYVNGKIVESGSEVYLPKQFLVNVLEHLNIVLYTVKGHALHPEIQKGDDVLVDLDDKKLSLENFYLFSLDESLFMAQVFFVDGAKCVMSTYPEPSQLAKGEDLEKLGVVGRIIWISRNIA